MNKILLILLTLLLPPTQATAQTPTTYITDNDSITTLKQWTFYDQALIVGNGSNGERVNMPHRWGNLFGNKNGYGSYVTTVQFDEHLMGELYAIHIPYAATAYSLYFNGIEQVSVGTVATNADSYAPKQHVETHYFEIDEPELVITLQVANFSNMIGGAEREITIGPRSLVMQNYQSYTNKENFILGGFLFMVINVLTLFYFRRQDRSYLWVGLIGFFLMIWYVFSKDHLIMDLFPNLTWQWMTKIEILIIFLAYSCYNKYIAIAYEGYYNPKIPVYSFLTFVTMAVLAIFLPADLLVTIFNISSAFIILFALHVAVMSYSMIRDKRPYAKSITLSNILFFIPFVQDMLYIQGFLNTNYYSIYGFMFFAISYLIQLNHQHTNKYLESELYNLALEKINQELEDTVEERTRELREKNNQLELLTVRDGLTNIANRRYFDQQMAIVMNKVKLENIPCSLILFDIDFFKKYNDHYGHLGGDEVLKKVAQIAVLSVGDDEIVARYGGEEFAVILPNKSLDDAHLLANFIRKSIANEKIEHIKSEEYGVVTISVGVAQASVINSDVNTLIASADASLYAAKNSGRNRVCYDGGFIPEVNMT